MITRRDSRPMRPTALLTLGRLPVALEIARALHAAGWRVVVAEPLPLHLCRASRAVARCRTLVAPREDAARYLDELARIVVEEGASLVVPVSEETVHVAALHGRLPADVALACPSRAALLALHDKWRFATRARALGLPVPATALGSTEAAAEIAARGPYVSKPRLSCSGVGVVLHDGPGSLDAAIGDERHLVQSRLPGPTLCAQALAADGRVRALVAYRSLLEAGSVSVTFERVAVPDEARRTAEAVVGDARWSGPIAFDFVADAAGRWCPIECNPRATSGLHLLPPASIVESIVSAASAGGVAAGTYEGPDREGGESSGEPTDGGAPPPPVARSPTADEEASERVPLGGRRQELWSALAELEGRVLRGHVDGGDWKRLVTTRDVDWSARDPLPFLTMVLTGAPLLWRALRARRPITEVTMADMGWYADLDGVGAPEESASGRLAPQGGGTTPSGGRFGHRAADRRRGP